jgi:hypothetical protein
MPTIRPASMTPEHNEGAQHRLRDHDALGGVSMELADELISAGLERADRTNAFDFPE